MLFSVLSYILFGCVAKLAIGYGGQMMEVNQDCAVVVMAELEAGKEYCDILTEIENELESSVVSKEFAVAGVRCCGLTVDQDLTNCPNSDCEFLNFMQAEAWCIERNLRLCTSTEILIDGRTQAEGCQLYQAHIWTSEEVSCPDLVPTRTPSVEPLLPVPAPTAADFDPTDNESSLGFLTVSGASPSALNPRVVSLVYTATGAEFTTDILFEVNGAPAAGALVTLVDITTVTVDITLPGGESIVDFFAIDVQGFVLSETIVLWSGGGMLNVFVVDEIGATVVGASVTVALADNSDVSDTRSTEADGMASFPNVPIRTLIVTAKDSAGGFGTGATVGTEATETITVTIRGFIEPSAIANNDFSLGTTEGWDVSGASTGIVSIFDSNARRRRRLQEDEVPDFDMLLGTRGEGEQRCSRAFVVTPGVAAVKVRYQFITSEVPGGFFGSQFNDYFSVSIRSIAGGDQASETNAMNGLGLSSFDFASGATAVREVNLAVDVEGDTIQVDVTVANVEDRFFDSQLIVDGIFEDALTISELELNDLEGESESEGKMCADDKKARLIFLSADSHTFFGGKTRILGTITIKGEEGCDITEVRLEVIQGGAVVATGDLAEAAKSKLITTIPAEGKLEITETQRLFDLPSAEADKIDSSTDGTVNLKVVVLATKDDGSNAKAEREFGTVRILGLYSGDNRFSFRDPGSGGDGWALPSTLRWAENIRAAYPDITYNDFCNMNCGCFEPHSSHDAGNDVDCKHPTYTNRDAAAAQLLIDILNTPIDGARVQVIGVTFTESFEAAINGVMLEDGRMATTVIRNWAGHDKHFHVRLL